MRFVIGLNYSKPQKAINNYLLPTVFPATEKNMNITKSAATIVEPTGVPAKIEIKSPETEQKTLTIAEQIITDLKLLKTRIAEIAGKITSALINREPTKFIARTMITAIIIAIARLYTSACVPTAFAKFSSNVTAKILL